MQHFFSHKTICILILWAIFLIILGSFSTIKNIISHELSAQKYHQEWNTFYYTSQTESNNTLQLLKKSLNSYTTSLEYKYNKYTQKNKEFLTELISIHILEQKNIDSQNTDQEDNSYTSTINNTKITSDSTDMSEQIEDTETSNENTELSEIPSDNLPSQQLLTQEEIKFLETEAKKLESWQAEIRKYYNKYIPDSNPSTDIFQQVFQWETFFDNSIMNQEDTKKDW